MLELNYCHIELQIVIPFSVIKSTSGSGIKVMVKTATANDFK
jgi:hypothetical protein